MAEPAVTFLLENVRHLLKHHGSLISGAKDELQRLNTEVDQLKAFLQDVAKKPKEDRELRDIERQIREVVYDVEDTIDACLTQAAAANTKKLLFRHLNKRHIGLQKEVKSLRERRVKPILDMVNAYKSTVAYGAPSTSEEEPAWTFRKKDQTIRGDNVVGVEDEAETIIGYLMEQKEKLDVISMTGMRGLGKTTLAWKIFQNEIIAFEFPIRIWIYVSQKFNKRDTFLNILKNFTSQDMSSLNDHELIQTVRACLTQEKFFLVLDDVCSVDDWKVIQEILPMSNGMGKVLITSCDNIVSAHASFYRKPHTLRFLTPEESWELLQLEVFGQLGGCPQELERIGKLIAHKCDGLPPQIVAVGGILVDRFMNSSALGTITREWEKVSENVELFLHNEKSISDVVELTYSRLPDELREGLLYMGMFPEDYEISAWTLTRLWIAEGFVQSKNSQSLEETATQNLNDLISRNLVMAGKISPNGEVKTCRVHDMIRRFCIQKAQEQNLFQVVKRSQEGVLEPPVSELHKFRRLCVHSNVNTLLSEVPKSQRVRSFLCFSELPTELDPRYTTAIPDAFDLLKVLESKSIKFNQIPRGITRQIHLRYITLSVDNLIILPETFSQLWNLQTLVVHTQSRLITIKANIWRLIRLRHLKTNAAIVLSSKGEGEGEGGEDLQTLDRLSAESFTADVCARACNLKTLGIRGKLATLFGNLFLSKLNHVEKLKLVNDLLFESASENPMRGLPQHSFFPPNLKSLTLSNTFLQWKHMSTLAKITNLEVLKLKDHAFTGIYWSAADDCFSNLQFLLISNADLVQWEASPSSLPRLSCLVLKNCENLNVIPGALAKTLEKLDINRVRKSAVESAIRIAEEKKQEQELEKAKWRVPFKLYIGPGCY